MTFASSIAALMILSLLTLAGCGAETRGSGSTAPSPDQKSPIASTECTSCHSSAYSSGAPRQSIYSAVSAKSSAAVAVKHMVMETGYTDTNRPGEFLYLTTSATTKSVASAVDTGKSVAAAATTGSLSCATCHDPDHQNNKNKAIRKDWSESVHGNGTEPAWIQINGKLSGYTDGTAYTSQLNSGSVAGPVANVGYVCVRCHTTTGYINFVTSDFSRIDRLSDGTDKTKEVLTCNGCHTDVKGTIRTVSPFRGFWGYSTVAANGRDRRIPKVTATYTFSDFGASNVCVPCHVGRNKVNSSPYLIKALNGYDAYSTVRTRSGGDGTIIGTNGHGYRNYVGPDMGYQFAGANYAENANSHSKVGSNNLAGLGSRGPCVGCHMRIGTGHTFLATNHYADYKTVCAACHDGKTAVSVNQAYIDNLQILRTDTVKVIQALIANKFRPTGTTTPTSFVKIIRWYTNPSEKAKRADYQGANYNASYVGATNMYHNPLYSRRLLFDSADFVVNGQLTGNPATISAAIDALAASFLPAVSGRDTATQKANAKAFLASRP